MKPHLSKFKVIPVLILGGMFNASFAVQDSSLNRVRAAALLTQKQCQMLLHHDAQDFVDCVDGLLKPERNASIRRLGIEYFGWVGALNSARMSFPGATDAADHYLRLFRKTQRKLKISDEHLCASVPGDCVQRNARMLQLEALPPSKELHFDGRTGTDHRH